MVGRDTARHGAMRIRLYAPSFDFQLYNLLQVNINGVA